MNKILSVSLVAAFLCAGSALAFSSAESSPTITFGQSYDLKSKPTDKARKIAKFSAPEHVITRYEYIKELMREGKMQDALKMAGEFEKESSRTEINVNFTSERDLPSQVQYLMSLVIHADILRQYGEEKKAAEKAQKALTIAEAIYEWNSLDYIMASPIIAKSMWDEGFMKLAKDYIHVNYGMSENVFPNQQIQGDLAVDQALYNSMVGINTIRDDVLPFFEIAERVYRLEPGLASIEYGSLNYYWALAYWNKGDTSNVLVSLDRAKQELEVSVSKLYPDNIIFAEVEHLYGKALLNLFKNKEAASHLKLALEKYEKTLGAKNMKVAQTLRELAIAQKYEKEIEDATINSLRGLDIVKELQGSESVELLDHYMVLAGIYVEAQKNKDAIDALNKARELNDKYYGRYSDIAKLIESNLKYVENADTYMWKK